MTPGEHERQARAFLSWHRRIGGPWEERFGAWAATKHLRPRDLREIRGRAEAMEGERKGLMDDHLPHRPMAEVELADALIRLFDYAGGFALRLSPDRKRVEPGSSNRGEALLDIVLGVLAVHSAHRLDHYPTESAFLVHAIRSIVGYCERFGHDLWGAFEEKMAYNRTRADHTPEHRLAEGGKKW